MSVVIVEARDPGASPQRRKRGCATSLPIPTAPCGPGTGPREITDRLEDELRAALLDVPCPRVGAVQVRRQDGESDGALRRRVALAMRAVCLCEAMTRAADRLARRA